MYCTVQYMQALVILIHFYDELSSDSSHIVLNKKISLINVSILFYINFMFTPQTHTTRIVWLVKLLFVLCPCGGRDGQKLTDQKTSVNLENSLQKRAMSNLSTLFCKKSSFLRKKFHEHSRLNCTV